MLFSFFWETVINCTVRITHHFVLLRVIFWLLYITVN
jgi:hypothetical protein